jgi:hypothetical protein
VVRLVAAIGAAAALSGLDLGGSSAGVGKYSYGGAASRGPTGGVAATVVLSDLEHVHAGHVAAWVGVGGPGLGQGGGDAWIQVGVNGFPGTATGNLYLEIKRGAFYRYAHLADGVTLGERHRIAVLEDPSHPSWWRASVDGVAVGTAVFLPGSHGRWPAQVVAESWLEGSAGCNGFAFRFFKVAVRYGDARSLTSLIDPLTFAEDGITLSRSDTGFSVRRRCA